MKGEEEEAAGGAPRDGSKLNDACIGASRAGAAAEAAARPPSPPPEATATTEEEEEEKEEPARSTGGIGMEGCRIGTSHRNGDATVGLCAVAAGATNSDAGGGGCRRSDAPLMEAAAGD